MPIMDGVYIYNEKSLQAYCSKALLLKGGGHLLSRMHCSTIGAGGLNFSVRNGKRWDPAAIAT